MRATPVHEICLHDAFRAYENTYFPHVSLNSFSVRVPHNLSKASVVKPDPESVAESMVARLPGAGFIVKPMVLRS
jgi:hypothetical protein